METITEKNYKKDYMLMNIIKNKVDLVQEEKTIQKNLLTIVGIDLIGNRQMIIIPLKFTLNKKNQNMVKFI